MRPLVSNPVWLAALGCALLINASPVHASQPENLRYSSSRRTVAVDLVRPEQDGLHPAVILLHGRAGLALYASRFAKLESALLARGFIVLIPHYFDASGDSEPPEVTPERFERWRQALADALAFASHQPGVDPTRIGVVGVSLGGFLAGVQPVQDVRIAALVSESAGVSTWFPRSPSRMPPLLVVHSRRDPTVPLADALRLAQTARRLGTEPEIALYEGSEHLLEGDVAHAANERVVGFLETALRGREH